ncbi:SDR family NAD(P)-dependent oxidoreductase [Paraburkholderia sp. MM5384-R2]|uniref:SDR family NAD(P)-dependent oxidoreductase n=1 Tax=Paraburkholderia sp. MM5384-R2 TaxID=2723097 RepID=UPI00160A7DD7|nr:SDR family NAD(P)-dependent oxidoreductase [Paraburkholderia sp. MM5384-R2]MBB5498833.1 NAD(P)-dependent dehydrogenase (short-subunit alcohol dehydrogenase family) [Paraburkholderia sp. MM5384-R2]
MNIAVVTGGASGIGAATAIRLARDGFAVAVWDRTVDAAARVAADIETSGGRAYAVGVDVGDVASVESAAAATREVLGVATALVNCAGIRDLIPFFDLTAADWQKVVSVCLSGPFHCTRALAPGMKERGSGTVVNIGSIASLVSRPDRTAYVSSKAGLLGLTRSNAEDLGRFGIRVNCVAPGFIETPLGSQSRSAADTLAHVERIPLGRIGSPDDVADVVSFFCNDASRYVTGTVLPVDGGRMVVY